MSGGRAVPAGCRALLLVFLFHPLLALPAVAQTVRPVIVEHQGGTRSKFEVVNDTLFPLMVVLEPKSFSILENGEAVLRPLDKEIHLKLSAMSLRLPPQQSRFVYYEVKAEKLPAWFIIYCDFSGMPAQNGINVQIELPHTVYLLPKSSLARQEIRLRVLPFDQQSKRIKLELENTGPNLGRVLAVEVSAKREKKASGGFPLLPEGHRLVEIPWDAAEAPEQVVLRFQGFKLEERLPPGKE